MSRQSLKVLAADVHRTIRDTWKPVLADLGLKRTRGYESWSCWSRSLAGGEWQTLWVQLNAHGWRDHLGSCLTLELQQTDDPEPGSAKLSGGRGGRWSRYVHPADLDIVKKQQVAIRSRPVPLGVRLGNRTEQFLLDSMSRLRKEDDFVPGSDIWLLYRTEDDVAFWADFLGSRLPSMLDRLAAPHPH